ncbi:MAG: signal recognition particle subunit SRP19/SEC65 family protein [Halobacteria archaeon]
MSEVVIWPAYLDSSKTRSEGRRIPKESGVSDPTLEEIAKAVKQVGYDPDVELDKDYPRSWWEEKGRVVAQDVDDSKKDVLRAVAVYVDAMRG